jgi:hypothetical protein
VKILPWSSFASRPAQSAPEGILSQDMKVLTSGTSASVHNIPFLEVSRSSSETAVPVGGVIMWWGDWTKIKDRPKGFDLCDGSKIRDEESG